MFFFFNTFSAHLFANRDQLDKQERSSLTPENAERELGFSEEAEPGVMKRQKQRRKTDKSSSYNDGNFN